MTVSIRQAKIADRKEIERFLIKAYGPLASYKNGKQWDWQFITNPFGTEKDLAIPIWIALDGAEVVGQIAVQPARLQIDNVEYAAGWIVDAIILPRYRGQALGHRLHDEVAASVPVLVTLTMAPAMRRIAGRAGGITLGPVRQFVKLLHLTPRAVRKYLLARTSHRPHFHKLARIFCLFQLHYLVSLVTNALLAIRPRNALPSCPPDLEVTETSLFDEQFDGLWMRYREQYPAIFVRNSEYLNWRFIKRPHMRYRCFIAKRFGQCVGYIVMRCPADVELPIGKIVDFFAAHTDGEAIECLLLQAMSELSTNSVALDCGSSVVDIQRALRNLGFFCTRTHHPTFVCSDPSLRQRVSALKDRWFFTQGDQDWDQIRPA